MKLYYIWHFHTRNCRTFIVTGDAESIKIASTEIDNIVESWKSRPKVPLKSTQIGQLDFTPIYKKKAPNQGSAKKPITSGKSAEKVQKEAIPAQKLKREGKTQTKEENSKEEVQLNYPAGMKQKSITGKNGEKLEQIMQSSGATISIDGDKGFFLFLIEAFFFDNFSISRRGSIETSKIEK